MKKIFYKTSIVFNIILIIGLGYLYHARSIMQNNKINKIDSSKNQDITEALVNKKYRIAIFEPVLHPAIEEIEQGFINTLRQQGNAEYDFKVYNANGDKTLMRSQAEDIVQSEYDLIFTIGMSTSQIAKEVTDKKQKLIPIVFSAVDDPVGMQLVDSLSSSGNHVTGITEAPNYKQQLSLLLTLKPTIKNVLLVYDPSHGTGLEKDKYEIQHILNEKGISLQSIEIYQANEIQQKVASSLSATDVVLTLRDNTTVSGIDSLVKLCNNYGVTLFASDLNSGNKGAALSYGFTEYEFGVSGAHKAYSILEEQNDPALIPITPISNYKIKINSATAEKQNLIIDPHLFFLMTSTEITNMQKEI